MEQIVTRKKLIEVSLPLDAINAASVSEKQPFTPKHPRSLHVWWARLPLVAARAVLFAQLVDDPSSRPELFPTEEEQNRERRRLFDIIEKLVKWQNTTNETVLEEARDEVRKSWWRACEDNREHPRAEELFNPDKLPAFHDPFAGGGAIPLEAQRLGLEAHASDLNPVAVLINKAMIEIPPKFAGTRPVNPEVRYGKGSTGSEWKGAAGLAEDVLYYGKWIRDEAEKRIVHLYPEVEVTAGMALERPDLEQYVGRKLTVIAWLWVRTVKSPNPAFAGVDVPLASSFVLSSKKGKEAYVQPVTDGGSYRFTVRVGVPPATAKNGTKMSRGSNFRCVVSGVPIGPDYIRSQGQSGHMGSRLMAIVAEGDGGRVYIPPVAVHQEIAAMANPEWRPEGLMPDDRRWFSPPPYGMNEWADLFTDRQLVALAAFSDLVAEARDRIKQDAITIGMADDGTPLRDGGNGVTAYADAVGVYLAMATSRWSDISNSICTWNSTNQNIRALFSKQAIQMSWDYAELSPFSSVAPWFSRVESFVASSDKLPSVGQGVAIKLDATSQKQTMDKIVSTDPPYYDNVGYADLSDFFYVWLRRSLRSAYPEEFSTLAVPKLEELVATPYRHGSKENAGAFFLSGMSKVLQSLACQSHRAFPTTVYYAFKQSEVKSNVQAAITGWETFLGAIVTSGFSINGTWPVETQRKERSIGLNTNALASSIVLVCRPRAADSPTATRREFLDALRSELPAALRKMQQGNIAPVDLAQAAIGPGMAIFTRYAQVLDASGAAVSVREALALINETLDEVLAEQEGAFDADTRWAVAWFEQSSFDEGDFGVAETLSKAKNTSISGMVEAGILRSGAGKVRLLRPNELPEKWEPERDSRCTAWEVVHHLVRVHDKEGESATGSLLAKLGSDAEAARDLAYRLYRICDRKNRPQEALGYNALVRSWGEISSQAAQARVEMQGELFGISGE